jgi:hypothetical protein
LLRNLRHEVADLPFRESTNVDMRVSAVGAMGFC